MVMTSIEYIKHGYFQDLDYFGKVGGNQSMICGWTASGLVKHYQSFINSAYFIAMVAEHRLLARFLNNYFGEYSLSIPISPDPYCDSAHGGIVNVSSMLSYFEREILDSRYVPNPSQMSELKGLLVNEYVHKLSMKQMGEYHSRNTAEPFSFTINEVSEAIIAGYLYETNNQAFSTFLKFEERHIQRITIERDMALQARRLSDENENQIRIVAKKRKAIKASENLYNAIRRGDERAVKALLLLDADINTLTPSGESLLDFARRKGNSEIIGMLKHKH